MVCGADKFLYFCGMFPKIFAPKFLFLCLALAASCLLWAQGRKELEKRRQELNKELQETAAQLKKASKERAMTMEHLEALGRQVSKREEMLSLIASERAVLVNGIDGTQQKIQGLDSNLTQLRGDYADMARQAWRSRNARKSTWAYIFSSADFNQAWRRWQYIKRGHDYRKHQVQLMLGTSQDLQGQVQQLSQKKSEKDQLIAQENEQLNALESETQEKEKLANQLKDEEGRLKAKAEEIESQKEKLKIQIEELIKAEIAKAREEARKQALALAESKKSKRESSKAKDNTAETAAKEPKKKKGKVVKEDPNDMSKPLPFTPQQIMLSENFSANRGKLPWPVEQGLISSKFGKRKHAIYSSLTTQNHGIDITTNASSQVKCVADGKVITSFFMAGSGTVVLVEHGQFYTVYSSLESSSVKMYDMVKAGQTVGVARSQENMRSIVHFEVWQGKTKLDPELWLRKR